MSPICKFGLIFRLFLLVDVLNWCVFGFDGGPGHGAWFEVT